MEPKQQVVDYGRPAIFKCNVRGNPVDSIGWLKDTVPLGNSDPVLRIDSVTKADRGMYQCFARNERESAQATGELRLGGRFDPPEFVSAFDTLTTAEGPFVSLRCVAKGDPRPDLEWRVYGQTVSSSGAVQIGTYDAPNGDVVSHLNISQVRTFYHTCFFLMYSYAGGKRESAVCVQCVSGSKYSPQFMTHLNTTLQVRTKHGGLYECRASSKVGSVTHSARLNVHGAPFVRRMTPLKVVAGRTMWVTCPVAGYPISSVGWEKGGRQLPFNDRQTVFPNGTLVISGVQRKEDAATYTCVARNDEGYSARSDLDVTVMGKSTPVLCSSFLHRLPTVVLLKKKTSFTAGTTPSLCILIQCLTVTS